MASGSGASRLEEASPCIRSSQGGHESEPMWSRTGYGEGMHLTQGNPPVLAIICCHNAIKLRSRGRPRGGGGTEGDRFTGTTYDTGPMKPGNGVEEKTLSTGKEAGRVRRRNGRTRHLWQSTHILPEHIKPADIPGCSGNRYRCMESCGRKKAVTTRTSRMSFVHRADPKTRT